MRGIQGYAGSPTEGAVKLQELLNLLDELSSRRRHDAIFDPGPSTEELMIVVRVGGLAERDIVATWRRRNGTLVFSPVNGIRRMADNVEEAHTITEGFLLEMLGLVSG